MNIFKPGMAPSGLRERYAVTSTAGQPALATSFPSRASYVLVQNIGADIYFTLDGSTPSGTAGFLLPDKEMICLSRQEFVAAKFYCATTSALECQPECA